MSNQALTKSPLPLPPYRSQSTVEMFEQSTWSLVRWSQRSRFRQFAIFAIMICLAVMLVLSFVNVAETNSAGVVDHWSAAPDDAEAKERQRMIQQFENMYGANLRQYYKTDAGRSFVNVLKIAGEVDQRKRE